jgi:hypothetical protein
MIVVSVRDLSRDDMRLLGNNLMSDVRADRAGQGAEADRGRTVGWPPGSFVPHGAHRVPTALAASPASPAA